MKKLILILSLFAYSEFALAKKNKAPEVKVVSAPLKQETKEEGFKITKVVKGGFYDRLGLKDGDVLLKCDNKPIVDIAELKKTFESLQTKGGGMKLEFSRKGKIEVMKYDFKSD